MTIITALEIAENYPVGIAIEAFQNPASKKWTSMMYLCKDKTSKLLMSYDGFPFDTEDEAMQKMDNQAKQAIVYAEAIAN